MVYYQCHSNKNEEYWTKPYYYDEEDITEKLLLGIFYRELYFSNNLTEKIIETTEINIPILR